MIDCISSGVRSEQTAHAAMQRVGYCCKKFLTTQYVEAEAYLTSQLIVANIFFATLPTDKGALPFASIHWFNGHTTALEVDPSVFGHVDADARSDGRRVVCYVPLLSHDRRKMSGSVATVRDEGNK